MRESATANMKENISSSTLPQKRPLPNDAGGVQGFPRQSPFVGKCPATEFKSGGQMRTSDFAPSFRPDHEEDIKAARTGDRRPLGELHDLHFEQGQARANDLGVKRVIKPSSKPAGGKVKQFDPLASANESEDHVVCGSQKENQVTEIVQSHKDQVRRREKIKELMAIFNEVYEVLSLDNRLKPAGKGKIDPWRVPGEAAKVSKRKMKWLDAPKIAGPICGVQIGDQFNYRAQLQMVGLHTRPQHGIDYVNSNGHLIAISVVDSHRYPNSRESCNVLFYSGQGGAKFVGSKQTHEDQKLEGGNLALRNSMRTGDHIRVIRKIKRGWMSNEVFVYDGLYTVVDYKQERGDEGRMIFKFQLNRNPGQPDLHRMLNA